MSCGCKHFKSYGGGVGASLYRTQADCEQKGMMYSTLAQKQPVYSGNWQQQSGYAPVKTSYVPISMGYQRPKMYAPEIHVPVAREQPVETLDIHINSPVKNNTSLKRELLEAMIKSAKRDQDGRVQEQSTRAIEQSQE